MIDKIMFSDRRGRRSLQGQHGTCSQIIKDNQFNFFQSNIPRKETTYLACAHNPSVGKPTAPFTQGSLGCVQFQKKQRKTKIVLWKCSILFGKYFGRKNVGTGVPDGPSLLCLLPCLQIPPNAWSALSTKLQKVRACTEPFCPHGGCWGMWHPSYV